MAYNPALISPIDRVRFAVGDTATVELLPDVTYTALLAGYNNDETKTTLEVARALITKYGQEPDKITLDGGQTESEWKSRLGVWRELVSRLEGELAAAIPTTAPRGFHTRRAERYDGDGTGSEYRR